MSAILEGFGKYYILPGSFVSKSPVITSILAQGGVETQTRRVNLNLDPVFEPAFNWVYQKWVGRDPGPFPADLFIDIFQIADYLILEDIFNEVRIAIINGAIPISDLISWYPYMKNNLAINEAILLHVVRNGHFSQTLPLWAQEYLDRNQTREFPENTLVLTRVTPAQGTPSTSATQIYPVGYSRICHQEQQPITIGHDSLQTLQTWQTLGSQAVGNESVLLTCPDPQRPTIGPKIRGGVGGACCYQVNPRGPVAPGFDILRNPQLQGKVPYSTPAGFWVYLDPGFVGDYLFSNNFLALPELKVIVPITIG